MRGPKDEEIRKLKALLERARVFIPVVQEVELHIEIERALKGANK